jgi:hypothetical protein
MKQLHKFLKLTSVERLLLIKAVCLLGLIVFGLKLLPFQTLRRFLAKIGQPSHKLQPVEKVSVDQIAWTVMVASHYIPKVKCLARALTTQVLLERQGYPTQLRIGFVGMKKGKSSAHAWVESEGRVVIGGGGNMARYIPVPLQALDDTEKRGWYLFS